MFRLRLATALISVSVLALELTLMRLLALRFWQHVAYLLVSFSLLGFGAGGSALTVLRRRVLRHRDAWLTGWAAAFAVSIIVSAHLAVRVSLDVNFLAWDPRQLLGLLGLELLIWIPFFFAGLFIGTVLMDSPERIGGHYAANLGGSAFGAMLAVGLMHWFSPEGILVALAFNAVAAAALTAPGRPRTAWTAAALGIGALALLNGARPLRPAVSEFKRLPFELSAGARTMVRRHGPMGRIDVLDGPAIHHHPGLAWRFDGDVPRHVLILTDGDQATAVYRTRTVADWHFMDATTPAVMYALREQPNRVALVGAGGGAEIGLARYHNARSITALEMNRSLIYLMRNDLQAYGGTIYDAPGVSVVNQEARGFFARAGARFDLIHVPPMAAFGAAGGGLYAAQESYLYTVESFATMWDRLNETGILAVTQWMEDPPRAGLRTLDTLAEMVRSLGLDPADRLALIRGHTTVTLLVSRQPWSVDEIDRIHAFSRDRGFDLGYLPGLDPDLTNRFHVLPRPYFFEAATALLGSERDAFLVRYPFNVRAATDDRPFFFHFFRSRHLRHFRDQLGGRFRAYLEPGYLLPLAAFVQSVVLAAVLILLPLVPGVRALRGHPGRGSTWAYFMLLGLGFMLLEMALLGRLILYLAHPIYSASVVIASFLFFAGLGSCLSVVWRLDNRSLIRRAGTVVAVMGVGYALGLNPWLRLSQAAPMGVRIGIAALSIAPLAVAMGHLFPAGLRILSDSAPSLTPWAWAINGFASVAASVGTPLLAMHLGYFHVGLIAVLCYAGAAFLGPRLPGSGASVLLAKKSEVC